MRSQSLPLLLSVVVFTFANTVIEDKSPRSLDGALLKHWQRRSTPTVRTGGVCAATKNSGLHRGSKRSLLQASHSVSKSKSETYNHPSPELVQKQPGKGQVGKELAYARALEGSRASELQVVGTQTGTQGRDASKHVEFQPQVPQKSKMKKVIKGKSRRKGGQAQGARLGTKFSRPQQGSTADVIEFGIICKELTSINFAQNTFSADVVVTLLWQDNRTLKLIPKGYANLSMATDDAKEQMWLPDISVTNRELYGFEVISTTLNVASVNGSGLITQTDRIIASMRNNYDVINFPFDSQNLSIRIASSTLMEHELMLKVSQDQTLSGVDDDTFDSKSQYVLNGLSETTHTEIDGTLRKSRGSLYISVSRHVRPILAGVLMPELMLLLISWCVFCLPLLPAFVVPRVMTSLISLLAFMTYSARTCALLPPSRNGLVWLEVWEEDCQIMMFVGSLWNTLIECAYHKWECKELAQEFNDEAKYIFIGLSIFMGCSLSAWDLGDSLPFDLVTITRIVITCVVVGYAAFCIRRLNVATKDEKDRKDSGD